MPQDNGQGPDGPPGDPVLAQYEAYPYPARDPDDEAKRLISGSPSSLAEVNHYLFEGRRDFTQGFRALVAGGGTGDAAIMVAQQ
ncbi:MAG: class I SAM-dependent methyltransferase, partial [Kiloniellales bacterium]